MPGNLDSQKESSPKGCLVYSFKICVFRKKVSDCELKCPQAHGHDLVLQ